MLGENDNKNSKGGTQCIVALTDEDGDTTHGMEMGLEG